MVGIAGGGGSLIYTTLSRVKDHLFAIRAVELIAMESFRTLTNFFEQEEVKVNFLKALPTEIWTHIVRLLDDTSLWYAAKVSRSWRISCLCELKRRHKSSIRTPVQCRKQKRMCCVKMSINKYISSPTSSPTFRCAKSKPSVSKCMRL